MNWVIARVSCHCVKVYRQSDVTRRPRAQWCHRGSANRSDNQSSGSDSASDIVMHAVYLSQAALAIPYCHCSLYHVVFVDTTQALWLSDVIPDGMYI